MSKITNAVLLSMFAAAAQAETINTEWNNVALQAIRDTKPSPPVTARALAIINTCMYDAWAAYSDTANGTRYGGNLRQPSGARTPANKQEAISYAAYMALSDLFPTRKAQFTYKLNALGYTPSNSTDVNTPDGIANVACGAVLAYRHNDGSNQLHGYVDTTGYAPVNTPDYIADVNHWQPLRLNGVTQKFVTPHWKNVTPFALTSGAQFLPNPPAQFGSSEFVAQAKEVMDITANLTPRQKVIAEYWADGPNSELPPGHWVLFAGVVSDRDNHTVDDDSKMYFALTNALFDASIGCWTAKVTYDSVRPITAIRYLFDADWKPYQPDSFLTPPFAEYTSGHSTFSAAAATVLKRFTGSEEFNYSVTVKGVELSWRTFEDAADEAGMSRRYGGIHFEDGDLAGRHMGKKIGEQVWKKSLSYFGD